ncbi:MAG: TIGR00725 family protein, partial [Desulfovibrionaceae bacterium]
SVVCGGLSGVMRAACEGAAEAGGLTIGILPGNDRSAANPFVAVPVATGLGQMRNALVVANGLGAIAISGGAGTLSEIGHALKAGKPVVAVGNWAGLPGVRGAQSAREAVEIMLGLIGRIGR